MPRSRLTSSSRSYGPLRQVLTAARHAALAANARRPLSGSSRVALPVFAFGWHVSELPLLTLAANGVSVGRMLRHGAARTTAGRSALATEAVTAAGLLDLQRAVKASQPVLEAALSEGLPPGYHQDPREAGRGLDDPPLTRRQTVAPAWISHRSYVEAADVAYGPAGKRNTLDVWRRPGAAPGGAAPVLLQVHGGGWVMGNKRQQAYPLLSHMADAGWVCVAINYRLSPGATWPDHIVDVKRAIAWVKEHIAEHGGDPGFIAITGGSAGGHLASLAALTPNHKVWQPGFEEADTRLQAAVPMYGVYDLLDWDGQGGKQDSVRFLTEKVMKVAPADDPQRWRDASPVHWAGPEAPPFMMVHGTNDSLVPVDMARRMARRLRQASSAPVVYAELPRTQHAFDGYSSARTVYTVRAVGRFLTFVRAGHLAAAHLTAGHAPPAAQAEATSRNSA